jgi:NADH-quinone oxidoreductase subunit E
VLSPELEDHAKRLVDRYPVGRSALLPLLHLVQSEEGHVSAEGVAFCARMLGLTKAEVAAVATFYTMYKREQTGDHLVSVCTNFSCAVRGAREVYDRLSEKLGVGHNGTTADGKFTLEHAECLGNCEGAPVVTVDYLNYECLSPEQAEELVDRIAAGEIPPPTRGPVPPGLRAAEFRLAGIGRFQGEPPASASPAEGRAAAQQPSAPVPGTDPMREEHAPADVEGAPADRVADEEAVEEQAGEQLGGRAKEFSPEEQGNG